MAGALEIVGTGLGHHANETGRSAAEFGRGAVGDDHELLHRVHVEGKGRTLTSPLLTEERIVEVGTVHHDVVLDALLAVHRDLVTVRSLHDGHTGGELGELQEVAAVVGQPVEVFAVDAHAVGGFRGLDQRRFGGDEDLVFGSGHLHGQAQIDGPADGQLNAFLHHGAEALQGRLDFVGTEGHQHTAETPGGVGHQNFLVICIDVQQGHGDTWQNRSGLINDRAFDDTGGGLGLPPEDRNHTQRQRKANRQNAQFLHFDLLQWISVDGADG